MPALTRPARRYLFHAALLTMGLAISGLFYNLLLVELGYDRRGISLPLAGETPLLGVLNSLPVLAAALSSLPIWWAVQRIGLRPALITGALLHVAALLGVALWPTPTPLLLCATLSGPAAALFQVSAAPFMIRHSRPEERDTLFALNGALIIGAAGLGSLIAGLLPGVATDRLGLPSGAAAYRATFAGAATLVALAALPLLLPAAPDGTPRLARPAPLSAGGLMRTAFGAWPFTLSPLLISLGAALLIPFLNLYFRQRYDAPDTALGIIFAAIGVATGAATLLGPWLSRRFGKIGSVVLTQALAIPCLLLLGLAPTLWLAATLALVRAALMNLALPLYDAYAMECTPEAARPMVIGLIKGAFSAGYIIGPTVSAIVQQRYGFGPLFVATASLYASAVAANMLLFLRPRRR